MDKFDYLIVGGGLASAKCVETLRKEGSEGSIAIVSADSYPPYHRPPLSKGLLLGTEQKEGVFVHTERFYEKKNISLILNTRVTAVDSVQKVIKTESGDEFGYGKLMLATAAAPRKMKIEGGDLNNVFYLRTLSNSEVIKMAMEGAKDAVIIGAGFIGMELASAFVQNGIGTTMLVREDSLFEKLGSERISDFFKDYYSERGVNVRFGEEAAKINGAVSCESVTTKDGDTIPGQIAAIGIGVIPEIGFLEGSGVQTNNGIIADEYLKTNVDGIFTAGDVANFYDPIFSMRRRIEHWDNAKKQGELVAKNMLGMEMPYGIVSYFFSDIFEISFDFLGDNGDVDEIVYRGSFADRSVIVFYLKENRLKAGFLLGRMPDEREAVESLIVSGENLKDRKRYLEKETFELWRLIGE